MRDSDIDKEGMDRFCSEHGFIGWFVTSAKLDVNVSESVNFLYKHVMDLMEMYC